MRLYFGILALRKKDRPVWSVLSYAGSSASAARLRQPRALPYLMMPYHLTMRWSSSLSLHGRGVGMFSDPPTMFPARIVVHITDVNALHVIARLSPSYIRRLTVLRRFRDTFHRCNMTLCRTTLPRLLPTRLRLAGTKRS